MDSLSHQLQQGNTCAVKPKKNRFSYQRLYRKSIPFLYIIPCFIPLVIFTHFPILRSFYLSFFEYNLASPEGQYIGIGNYVLAAKSPVFWQVARNNMLYALGTIPTSLILGLIFALLINQKMRGLFFYRIAVFYPVIIPMAAAAMIWLWIMTPTYGLLNYYGGMLGMSDIDWIQEPKFSLWALVIVGIWKRLGYYMIIFLAGLQMIPKHLYEAAVLDGASRWRQFIHITLPMLSPTIFFLVIMAVVDSFQSIDQVFLMTQGGPGNETNLFIYYIYENAFQFFDRGFASAISSILFAILLGFTFLIIKYGHKKVHYE